MPCFTNVLATPRDPRTQPISASPASRAIARRAAMTVLLITVLAGCATIRTPEEQAADYVSEARAFVAKGATTDAGKSIDAALARPTGSTLVKALFAASPTAQDTYLTYLRTKIAGLSDPYLTSQLGKQLIELERNGALPTTNADALWDAFKEKVIAGNASGAIPFTLFSSLDGLEFLKASPAMSVIVNRSITELQSAKRNSGEIAPLAAYVARVGPNSAEGQRIEALLPSMHIRLSELDDIAKVFPQFAATRREELTVPVDLQTKGADRLFLDDLRNALDSKLHVLRWVTSPVQGATVLTVDRVRYQEKTLPEHTETITYADYQVNVIAAALLMPRNASYRYDVTSGGAAIEYGFVVTAVQDGKQIFERVVRGNISKKFHHCQNARIQNVFGGVSPAGFVANDDMTTRCSGPDSVSLDSLREEVFAKLEEAVADVPTIRAVRQEDASDQ